MRDHDTDLEAYVLSSAGTELFRMARIAATHLHLSSSTFSQFVIGGHEATLTLTAFRGREFPAHVVSPTGAIAPTSRRTVNRIEGIWQYSHNNHQARSRR
jgi:hypothetical protein